MNEIFGIPSLADNYIWAIHGQNNGHIVVVDPGEAAPVLSYLKEQNLILDAILITHHHNDHTGGVLALRSHFPHIPVYGSLKDKVPGITHFIQDGDTITFTNQNLTLQVLDLPGHTHGHIAYYNKELLFCGDVLFSVGCGKIFEGTAEQMYRSLNKLKQFAPTTQIFSAHEYTFNNIKFAQMVDPENQALEKRFQQVISLRKQNLPTLPVSLASELQTNPFLRCEELAILDAVQNYWDKQLNDPLAVFEHLRRWKDQFKLLADERSCISTY